MGSGREYKPEEIIRAIRREEDEEERKSEPLLVNPQGHAIRSAPDSVEVIRDRDIRNQPYAINGHKVDISQIKDNSLKASNVLSDCYDEYLRMYQLAYEHAKMGKVFRSQISKKPVSDLKFEDWVAECRVQCQKELDEGIPKAHKEGKLSMNNVELAVFACTKNVEAYKMYLNATAKQQVGMV